MARPDAVAAHYVAQQRQSAAAALIIGELWRKMRGDDFDRSWAILVDQLVAVLGAAQLGAARAGAAYVPIALAQTGYTDRAAVTVIPGRFAGIASDGRPLGSLMYSAVIRAKITATAGVDPPAALAAGGQWLDQVVRTQVADASRGAAGVAIAARPRVGYVRMINPPCCQRCAVIAGRFFRFNTGFNRHPGCDCRHTPVTEDAADGYTDRVSPAQVKDLTQAQRQAITDGGDMNQVINARRAGRRSSDGMTTTEGTTRRSGSRLTPEGIYRVSASRDEVLRRLRDNGYVL